MKYSIAILSAATLATAVRPVLLNSVYNVVEGEPFTLTFQGCEDGCTITVEHGEDEESMKPVEVLTDSATGGEATVTLNELPSDSYAFRIVDNDTEEYNFSPNFDFEGTGEAPSTTTSEEETSTTETESSTTEETTTTTEEETTTTTEETSTTTDEETTTTPESTSFTTTSDAETTTPVSSTTTEDEETTTSDSGSPETTVPDGGAGALGRPMALVIGAVAAMLLLN